MVVEGSWVIWIADLVYTVVTPCPVQGCLLIILLRRMTFVAVRMMWM